MSKSNIYQSQLFRSLYILDCNIFPIFVVYLFPSDLQLCLSCTVCH